MDNKSKTEEINNGRNLIRFDWAMKRLLRNKADYVVLEGLLSVLLGESVKINSLLESEGNMQTADDKYNRVDIMVENDRKELIIVELQNCEKADYLLRMLYGVSKAITEHIEIGHDYTGVRKIYHINIVYFELGQGQDYVYQGNTSFKGMHLGDEMRLTDRQQNFFGKTSIPNLYPEFYILKVNDFDGIAKDNLDQWIYYLKNDAIPDRFTAPGLPEARERLLVDSLSSSERKAYYAHIEQLQHEYSVLQTAIDNGIYKGMTEGMAKGIEKGLAEGMEKGRAEGEEERKKLRNAIAYTVKNLVEQGFSQQQIAQIMQLDIEELG
jgi:predicted transposase/invertase (TIGR01784 family)